MQFCRRFMIEFPLQLIQVTFNETHMVPQNLRCGLLPIIARQ